MNGAAERHEVRQVVLLQQPATGRDGKSGRGEGRRPSSTLPPPFWVSALGRGEDAERHTHGDEVSQDEPLILVRARGAVLEREGEFALSARHLQHARRVGLRGGGGRGVPKVLRLRVEQGEAAEEVFIRDELRLWEGAPRHDLRGARMR